MRATEAEHVSWRELLNREHAPALFLVCMGVWLHAADSLIVATMMPAIIADIGGQALISWSVTLYEIGSIIAGAASGFLAMRHGLRVPMACAAVLFAAGCAVSAMAPTMAILLLGRSMQGIGGGGLVALSFVAAGVLFPQRLIPRALAAVSLLWGTSAFLGPLIGGLFVEYATWRSGFAFFAGLALLLALWIGAFARVRHRPSLAVGERVALSRLAVLAAGVVAIAYAGVTIELWRTSFFVVTGALALLIFFKLDASASGDRLLPREMLSPGTVVGAAIAMILCTTIATVAVTAYGAVLIVQLHATSALLAGYVIACGSIGWSIAAVSVSGASARHDIKFIALGMSLVAISVTGLLFSLPAGPVVLIAFFITLDGVGFGMAWVFILRQLVANVSDSERERVTAAMPTVQRLGFAIGAALIGIVANANGFADSMSHDDARRAAVAIYLASLPFAALGLLALAQFVRLVRAR